MWLRQPAFYIFCICYLGVRMFNNVIAGLLPFYLVDVLELGTKTSSTGISFHLGLIPGISSALAVVSTSQLPFLYNSIGRKKTLVLGTFIAIIAQFIQYFLDPDHSWVIYIVVALIGLARGLVVTTGINLISEVVGARGQEGAIVFGIYSFIDKYMFGIIIFLVTHTAAYSNPNTLSPD